jgi:ribose 1,5-bisphosphokinase
MTRYALYFAFAPGSPWWQAGCRWLGRDAASGAQLVLPSVPGVSESLMGKLTSDARRYGFHATLKAPFQLREGFDEEQLIMKTHAFAEAESPIALIDLRVRALGAFLALRPSDPRNELAALAMRCVSDFDELRAPPTSAELARRRRSGLSARQESLLQRWGYPYTEEEFRFHMTLTDPLTEVGEDAARAIRSAAEQCFAEAMCQQPPMLDALTIFREESPGAAFMAWKRFTFQGREIQRDIASPAAGVFSAGRC